MATDVTDATTRLGPASWHNGRVNQATLPRPSDSLRPEPVPSMWRKRLPSLGIVMLIALAAWMLITAFTTADTSNKVSYPKGIDSVDPIPKALTVPAQSPINVDLAFGYDGALAINGREIPNDQLNREAIKQTGVFTFVPTVGSEFKLLPGSVVTAKVIFWPVTGTRAKDAQEWEWTFSVN